MATKIKRLTSTEVREYGNEKLVGMFEIASRSAFIPTYDDSLADMEVKDKNLTTLYWCERL